MTAIATAFWVGGIASLAIGAMWSTRNLKDATLSRRIALMGMLYLALALLISLR